LNNIVTGKSLANVVRMSGTTFCHLPDVIPASRCAHAGYLLKDKHVEAPMNKRDNMPL
jgi:hypothetical protein